MGRISSRDFSSGWQPSQDAINAPPSALLRADNLVLDQRGAVALRPGSAKINSAAFSDTDVHSLFTAALSGTKTRMSGATSALYANGTSIASGFAGSGDIAMGSHMGNVLAARSTTKKKYDGTTVRTWGIAAPGAAPTLAVLSSDSKTFASCASGESPAMTSNEGTQAFVDDKSGNLTAACEITPDSTTARGTSTKTFGAATDFTTYDGGQTGTDDDLVEMDVYITEPQYLDRIALMIDVNDGTFQADYYVWEFVNGESIEVRLDAESEYLASDYTSEGFERDSIRARLEDRGIESKFRIDKPVSNTGWNHFSVPRGKMQRIGSTSGKNWSTVKAVRVSFVGLAGGGGAALRFDQIQITGGAQRALTGSYKAIVVAARNDGTYTAISAPSTASSEIQVKGQGIRATVDGTTVNALDTQVNELHLFLMGGRLDRYYRAAVKTGGPFSGAQTIDATSSDRTMMLANIVLETDNVTPPDSIIGIEGPHFDRTFCLTATYLYASQQRNPDSFRVITNSSSQIVAGDVVRVGDAAETALWVKKSREQLYVGTTRDIYRFDGDWTVLPDGTLNVSKIPLGVTRAPVSAAVAVGTVNGADTLVYLSSDGWRVLNGPILTDGAVDLLWQGQDRHGVSAVNIASASARFQCAITKNMFYALTPEGTDTTSSVALHVYHFGLQRWARYVYPQAFRSLYAEYDGTLIAGDSSGYVRTLDESAGTDDSAGISVRFWTPAMDGGELFTQKEAQNLLTRVDTGDATLTVGFHIDGGIAEDTSVSGVASIEDTLAFNLAGAGVSEFRQLQMRGTGTFSTFVLRGFDLSFLDRPVPMLLHDTGFVDLTDTTLVWLRRLNIKARASADITVQLYIDGTATTTRTITVVPDKEQVYDLRMKRDDRGATVRAVLTSTEVFNCYWVEWEYNISGKIRQKRVRLSKVDA